MNGLHGDIVPSLLAWPGDKARAGLLKLVDHPDNMVRQFTRNSLAAFDTDVLRRVIPPSQLPALGPGIRIGELMLSRRDDALAVD